MDSCTRVTRKRRGRASLALSAAAGITLAGCGTGAELGSAPPQARVTIESFAFTPKRVTVRAGTELVWINRDDILHTVTTGAPGKQGIPGVSEDTLPRADGILDRRLDGEGADVSFTFRDRGTYRYYCAIHAGMTGTVVVR